MKSALPTVLPTHAAEKPTPTDAAGTQLPAPLLLSF